jgi:developmentally-regulated GTP-binding protein 1
MRVIYSTKNDLTAVPISANHGWNFDELLEKMWEYLDLVRVYTKPRGLQPDFNDPVVLRRSRCTVEDFCNTIVIILFFDLLITA